MTCDVVAIWAEIDAWLASHAPTTLAALAGPVSEETVAAVERALGRALPPDVIASYRVHDGYTSLHHYEYVPLGVGLEYWQSHAGLTGRVSADVSPKIKPVYWHPGWFPVAMDGCGNLLCVDLDPEPEGSFGQVVWWEVHEGPFLSEHPSWGGWLDRFRRGLAAGEFGTDANGRIESKVY